MLAYEQSPANFDQLRHLVQRNNDVLREVIAAFEEKAALDFHYSKMLKKISANLHKATHQVESDIDKGWTSVAEQFDVQATIHSNLGSALTDDVVQPLRSIQISEAKTIRAAALFVERELRKLKDRKDGTTRTKRLLYECSKQLEKLEQANDQHQNGERMFERHTNNLDIAVQATANDYITAIQPSTAAVNHVILTDLYLKFTVGSSYAAKHAARVQHSSGAAGFWLAEL
ncbi:hypothetical protein OESDEN_10248 [Oesophagostomum dentatum]|uniref:FCH domain-containing protein n=1 Tax=Oesophagostomum dentatum TaxID=61180 RepID=A0A0B1T3C8_OESDE|nr:hypothetical protein OESDEN_10248 [Oesophagostomum dentatum]